MVCFVWLAQLIGPSFLAGVLALFLSVPCQAMVLKIYFKAQMERLKVTDQRVKLTNEMVQGMRVVKMYAWEKTIGAPCRRRHTTMRFEPAASATNL